MPDSQPPKGAHVKPDSAETRPGASTAVENTESKSTYESGGERREQREELEKNSTSGRSAKHPEEPAGLHRTGSFAGKAEQPENPSK